MPGQLDLGVGSTTAGCVDLDQSMVAFGHDPDLTFSRKGLRTDEAEVLIARGAGLGVDGMHIDLVGVVNEIGNDIPAETSHSTVGGREVPEDVSAAAADQEVVADVAL